MNLNNKLKSFKNKEDYIWNNNNSEINKINKKILTLLIFIIFVGSFILSIVSTFNESFEMLQIPYYIVFLLSIPILILTLSNNKIPPLYLLYLSHAILFTFSTYGGCIVVPDSNSTLILGFVFVFSLTVFDKSFRFNLILILLIGIYTLFALEYKSADSLYMDIITVLGFSLVASILGGYLRHLQLDNIDLRRQSKIRETTDPLTGLYNRGKLSEITNITTLINDVQAIIMIDIDYFKKFNDTYGHQEGDYCLKAFSDILKETASNYNVSFYRYGGEEFLGVLWNTENSSPQAICEIISTNIRNLHIAHEASPLNVVTISVGFSTVKHSKYPTFRTLLSESDKALYHSKNNGRNQVTSYKDIV